MPTGHGLKCLFRSPTQRFETAELMVWLWSSRDLDTAGLETLRRIEDAALAGLGAFTLAARCKATGTIRLCRTSTSTVPLYYHVGKSETVVSDTIAGVVETIDADSLQIDEKGLIDHFLFYAPVGDGTYYRNVRKLDISQKKQLSQGSVSTERFSTLSEEVNRHRLGDAPLAEAILASCRRDGNVRVMYSGGLDSTALACIFGSAELQFHGLRHDVYAPEHERALHGSQALDRPLIQVEVSHTEYCQRLGDFAKRMKCPTIMPQTLVHFIAVERDPRPLLCGKMADTLFGYRVPGRRRTQKANGSAFGRLRREAGTLRRAFRDPKKSFAQAIRLGARRQESLEHLKLTPQFIGILSRSVGWSAIKERIDAYQARNRFAAGTGDSPDPSDRDRFLEAVVGNMESTSLWHEVLTAHGVWMYLPFCHPAVVAVAADALLAPKSRDKKSLVADVVRKQAPGYNVGLKKLGGTMLPRDVFGSSSRWQHADERITDKITLPAPDFDQQPRKFFWRRFWLLHWQEQVFGACRQPVAPAR